MILHTLPTLPTIEYPPSSCPLSTTTPILLSVCTQVLAQSPLSSIELRPPLPQSGSDLLDKAHVASPKAMSSSTPVNQDPVLAPSPPTTAPPAGPPAADAGASPQVLDSTQIVQLLRHFPGVYQVSPSNLFFRSLSAPSWLRYPALECIGWLESHM